MGLAPMGSANIRNFGENKSEICLELIVLGVSGARDAVKNTPVGHISSHANAQLMRSDPDRVMNNTVDVNNMDTTTNVHYSLGNNACSGRTCIIT